MISQIACVQNFSYVRKINLYLMKPFSWHAPLAFAPWILLHKPEAIITDTSLWVGGWVETLLRGTVESGLKQRAR